MAKFNVTEYITKLAQSESIQTCEKVPLPAIKEDQNYIFISYSHKDYKQVYHDLAYLYDAGVRFWYDSGLTAGKRWSIEAGEKIGHPNCSGVIFYLSENLFLSRSVKLEILASLGKDGNGDQVGQVRNNFCVSIPGTKPSTILFSSAMSLSDEEKDKIGFDSDWIKTLMDAFSDQETYVNFTLPDHETELIDQIAAQFNVIDAVAATATVSGDYEGDMVGGKRQGYGVCKYENGNVYEGEWADNLYHGKGKMTYGDSDSRDYYDGYWEGGKSNGQGVFVMKSGKRFEGTFTDGNTTGNMTVTDPNGTVYEGYVVKANFHGYGKMTYDEDDDRVSYEGEWDNGHRHGNGVLTFRDGEVYKGEFKADKRDGAALVTNPDGSTWEGTYANDSRWEGFGTVFFSTGRVYHGQYADGQINGKGKIKYAPAETWDYYEGDFVDGTLTGTGTLVYRNGDIYTGQLIKGNYNGTGRITFSETDHREYYEGQWKDHKKHGHGIMVFRSGDTTENEWVNDSREGYGVYTYKNGSVYKGNYSNNAVNGIGTLYSHTGDVYIGEWKNTKYHGLGKNYYTEKEPWDYYEGYWQNGKLHGKGILVFRNGRIYDGEFDSGNYHGVGKMTYESSDHRNYYEGEWLNNNIHGNGTISFKNGNTYTGEFKDGYRDGYGTMTYKDSLRVSYEGFWKKDKQNGRGKMCYIDEYTWEGEWIDGEKYTGEGVCHLGGMSYCGTLFEGKRQGYGKMYYKDNVDGITMYDGQWANDVYDGHGKLYVNDRLSYDGEYSHSVKHGRGTLYVYSKSGQLVNKIESNWSSGVMDYVAQNKLLNRLFNLMLQHLVTYEGDYKRGKYHGKGVYSDSRGKYEGDFVKGKFEGEGKLSLLSGDCYEGQFKKGMRHGHGTMTYVNGIIFESDWAKDKPVGEGLVTLTDGSTHPCKDGLPTDAEVAKALPIKLS